MFNELIETSHGSIAFIDTGGLGVPVVMIHANSIFKESFKPQIEALSGFRRVIAFDLPGHGASGDAIDPKRTYSIPGYADALLEALESLNLTRFVAVGHSLGGHIVLEMLAKNAPVDGALIFGTPPISNDLEGLQAGFKPSPEMAYTGSAFLTEQEIGMVVKLALGQGASGNEFFLEAVRRTNGLARQYMIEAAVGGQGSNQRHVVETSPIPLAIINGEDDAVIDLDYVDSIVYANVWEGKPIRVCGAGHALHREQTQKFNETLLRFMDFLSG
ncbi:alpha/beta fold hydrolase [Agrobacterium tumefaciens]|uniref:alpha/beta fold hydrolase n=1 Tax=Agrobacterium tumefaciens TaxID=358 RepID=UPI000472E05E